jgi:hypothetical protein
MSEQIVKSGYHITTDPQFQNKRYGIPPELEKQLEKLAVESQKKGTSKIIDQLNGLIVKYPSVPPQNVAGHLLYFWLRKWSTYL